MNVDKQESDSSNSSPLSSNASGSQATTASLENGQNGDSQLRNEQQPTSTDRIFIEENGNESNSYMALDQLLASLAIENDIMERHLSQINNNDTNCKLNKNHQTNDVFSFDTVIRKQRTDNFAITNGKQMAYDENLNDVLANLLEFTENEALPQQINSYTNGNGLPMMMTTTTTNGTNYHHNNHLHLNNNNNNTIINNNNNNFNLNNHISSNGLQANNNNYIMANGHHQQHHTSISNSNFINHRAQIYQEPSNNIIKRLTSESENSSSVSPSLSERSNGVVSWSDQVCDCIHQKKLFCFFPSIEFSFVFFYGFSNSKWFFLQFYLFSTPKSRTKKNSENVIVFYIFESSRIRPYQY